MESWKEEKLIWNCPFSVRALPPYNKIILKPIQVFPSPVEYFFPATQEHRWHWGPEGHPKFNLLSGFLQANLQARNFLRPFTRSRHPATGLRSLSFNFFPTLLAQALTASLFLRAELKRVNVSQQVARKILAAEVSLTWNGLFWWDSEWPHLCTTPATWPTPWD